MTSRIRYSKSQDKNVLLSTNVYHHPSNGARYRVSIDLSNNTWSVLDDSSNKLAATGVGAHPHKLKIAAREALTSLGIQLQVENRERLVKTNLV